MSSLLKVLPWLFLPLAAAVAADAPTPDNPPIINFRLPTFNPDGYRTWLARGTEARRAGKNQYDVKELTLTIFTGLKDERIETMILSPSAHIQPEESLVTGKSTIRVINDQFEASGVDWSYSDKDKKITIARNVRISFRAEFKDLLQ